MYIIQSGTKEEQDSHMALSAGRAVVKGAYGKCLRRYLLILETGRTNDPPKTQWRKITPDTIRLYT